MKTVSGVCVFCSGHHNSRINVYRVFTRLHHKHSRCNAFFNFEMANVNPLDFVCTCVLECLCVPNEATKRRDKDNTKTVHLHYMRWNAKNGIRTRVKY